MTAGLIDPSRNGPRPTALVAGPADLHLPLILAGRVVPRASTEVVVETPIGRILVARPDAEDVGSIDGGGAAIARELAEADLRDVSTYLQRLGVAWLDRLDDLGRRWAPLLESTTGLRWRIIRADYESVGSWLLHRENHYDILRSELGTDHAFDEWQRVASVRQRAVGRGLVFHGLVGNIPMAGLFSVVRGLITRNRNLVKLPARDPLSVHLFARCAIDVAPDHPLTRGLSVLYWPRGDAIGRDLVRLADAACLWGSAAGIEQLRAWLRPTVPCVALGPRRSGAVIDLTHPQADVDDAAVRLAADVCFYDQEACLSPQRAHVLGDVDQLRGPLGAALERISRSLPRLARSLDDEAHIRLVHEEARVRGWSIDHGEDWLVVAGDDRQFDLAHPLRRTIFLHRCADLAAATSWFDDDTQTIAVHPYALVEEVGRRACTAGGSRIVELGLTRHPRRGFVHDGQRVLPQLVRWVAIEDDMVHGSRFGSQTPAELRRQLMEL